MKGLKFLGGLIFEFPWRKVNFSSALIGDK